VVLAKLGVVLTELRELGAEFLQLLQDGEGHRHRLTDFDRRHRCHGCLVTAGLPRLLPCESRGGRARGANQVPETLRLQPLIRSGFTTERLDAWYNHPLFDQLDHLLAAQPGLIPLSKVATFVQTKWKQSAGRIEYIEISDFDLADGTVAGSLIEGKNAPTRAKTLAQDSDVAVSHVRPNRQNVALIHSDGARPVVVTSGCTVLRFATRELAALYAFVLRHSAVTHQIMRWNVGTSYPALEGVLIDHILVPDFRDAKYEELGRQAREAVEAPQRAKL